MGAIIDIVMDKLGNDANSTNIEQEADKQTDSKKENIVGNLLKKTGSLTGLFTVLGVVFIVGASANAGRQILMTKASERVVMRLRNQLFHRLITQDVQFHDKNRSGELISRLSTDTTVVGRTLTSNIADGLRSFVMASSGLVAMVYVNTQLTLTTMSMVPFVAAAAVVYGRYVRKLSKDTTDASAELTNFAQEKLSNVRTVKAFTRETDEISSYNKKSENLFDLGMKEGYASALFFSSMGFSGNLIILAILYYGGSLVQTGVVSIGELTSFFLYTVYGNFY
jgi:ABC-type multidrug transport system fused ATPase/permease subunit